MTVQVMAIIQDVDKCIRCNGCVIACKRSWKLKGINATGDVPDQKIRFNQRVVVKPQKRVDTAPFVRYSCWHCTKPPCTSRCPWSAIKKDAATGAVYIDQDKCKPDAINPATGTTCLSVCQIDCVQSGFIRIGAGSDAYPTERKAQKCTMCFGRAGEGGDLPTKAHKNSAGTFYVSPLSEISTYTLPDNGAKLDALAHQPTCVMTCPAQAMYYDTRANAVAYLQAGVAAGEIKSSAGDGCVFWFSRKQFVSPPKADPFIEDHVSPMVSSMLNGPFAKAAIAPTLIAGGLLAIAARRATLESERTSLTGGEA